MVKRPEVLAVIPARGGSKGIPRKNIRDFAGHPLIAYSIQAAVAAQTVTRVIVSTDDEEIAQVARSYGAEVPFLRPADIAQDATLDFPVFEHVLLWLAEHENFHPEVVVQLRPTSPVRPVNMVDDAVNLLLSHPEADSVRGVVPAGQNPHKMWRISAETGCMNPLLTVEGIAEPYNSPRQKLPSVYWQTGHIDAIRSSAILEKHSMSGDVILPLQIDPEFTVDIDNPRDWQRSEWLVLNGGLKMVDPSTSRRTLPEKIELVVFDFDGVMTDDRVWVNQDGQEMIAANRADGMGVNRLHKAGVPMLVLSTEVNPVVDARCRKLHLEAVHGVEDKRTRLLGILNERGINPQNVVYVGNDINDIPCFSIVGCAVVVADAEFQAKRSADLVLSRCGGHGAVREFCDMILNRLNKRS